MWERIMEQMRRVARREVERVLKLQLQPRYGNVVEWDPKTHRAKVELQPEGVVSNWMPVESQWIGNGWGMIAVPNVGDQVKVQFPEYGSNQGLIVGRVYDERNKPPQGAVAGELLMVDQAGNWIALRPGKNKIQMHSSSAIEIADQGQTIRKLVIDTFQQLWTSHTHGGGPVVDQQMDNTHLTTVLKGN